MVSIGSSSSTPREGEETSAKEIAAVFGGFTVGIGILLVGVVGIIIALPEPDYSSNVIGVQKMLTSEQASREARERIKKSKARQSRMEIERIRQNSLTQMASSAQAAKAARARLIKNEYYSSEEPESNCEHDWIATMYECHNKGCDARIHEGDTEDVGICIATITGEDTDHWWKPSNFICQKCQIKEEF